MELVFHSLKLTTLSFHAERAASWCLGDLVPTTFPGGRFSSASKTKGNIGRQEDKIENANMALT